MRPFACRTSSWPPASVTVKTNFAGAIGTPENEWKEKLKDNRETVDAPQIEEVVSMISGVPVQRMAQAEGVKVEGDEAGIAFEGYRTEQDGRDTGKKYPAEPCGTEGRTNLSVRSFLLGPTGVGRRTWRKSFTRTCSVLPTPLSRIDMSEYMEKFTVSRLIGLLRDTWATKKDS